MSKRALLLVKAVIAFVAAAIIGIVVVPQMVGILNRPTIDQGTRPLVMVTTSGGDRDYRMRVHNVVDEDGNYRFVLSIVNDEVVYEEGANGFVVNVQITLAAPKGSGSMTCAPENATAARIEYADLGPGARRMLETDAVSGRYSSTGGIASDDAEQPSAGSASPAPAATPDFEQEFSDLDLQRYTADLSLLDTEFWYNSAVTSGDWVWTVECRLDAALVWRTSDPARAVHQPQATLMAPEFNFGPQEAKSDYQQDMDVTLAVARAEGLDVVRSYPDALAGSADWTMTYENRWSRDLGDEGFFGYTNAPTFLLANRNAAATEQNFLLFGGVLIGLALTLTVRGLSDLADALLVREKGEA